MLTKLFWRQSFNNNRLAFVAGIVDTTDYVDVYSDGDEPWKNVNTLFNVLAPATIVKHASVGTTYRLMP